MVLTGHALLSILFVWGLWASYYTRQGELVTELVGSFSSERTCQLLLQDLVESYRGEGIHFSCINGKSTL